MDEDGFWGIIETADRESGTGMDEKSEALKRAIGRLPETEASGFSELFDEKMDRAYTYPLWGAAYIMHGGCSDDTFADFRACLISRGRPQFEHAVADPDSLADEAFDRDAWFYEGYQYAVADGVEAAAGSRPPCKHPLPKEPAGEPWDERPDVLKGLYPRIWARFVGGWETSAIAGSPGKAPWWKFWH